MRNSCTTPYYMILIRPLRRTECCFPVCLWRKTLKKDADSIFSFLLPYYANIDLPLLHNVLITAPCEPQG